MAALPPWAATFLRAAVDDLRYAMFAVGIIKTPSPACLEWSTCSSKKGRLASGEIMEWYRMARFDKGQVGCFWSDGATSARTAQILLLGFGRAADRFVVVVDVGWQGDGDGIAPQWFVVLVGSGVAHAKHRPTQLDNLELASGAVATNVQVHVAAIRHLARHPSVRSLLEPQQADPHAHQGGPGSLANHQGF